MNISALLGCLFFYSSLYLLYYFFAKQQNPLLLLAAITLLIATAFIIPYPHQRRRHGFNSTLSFGEYFYWPLITWWRLFILPISWLIALLYRD